MECSCKQGEERDSDDSLKRDSKRAAMNRTKWVIFGEDQVAYMESRGCNKMT